MIERPQHLNISVVTTTDPRAGHLPALLQELSLLARDSQLDIEVVVVDDMKLWPSQEIANSESHPGLTIKPIWYPERRGQLEAMLSGITAAKNDIIYATDPDMFSCVKELPEMLVKLDEKTSLIHGARTVRGDIGLSRRLGSKVANLAVRLITGISAPDLQSSIALLRRSHVVPLLSTATEHTNIKLYLYARLGPALKIHWLKGSTPSGSPSQYHYLSLASVFIQLIKDSIKLRILLRAI